METQANIIYIAMLLVAVLMPLSAYAAEFDYSIPRYIAKSIIDGGAARDFHGKVAINQASGDANTQANAAAIAINPNGAAIANISIGQRTATGQATIPDVSVTRVGGKTVSLSISCAANLVD